jgi:hypothetical protein
VTRAANAELIEFFWRIGQYLHQRIEADGWAKATVEQLAAYIAQCEPGRHGFSTQNVWRIGSSSRPVRQAQNSQPW